jgi:hypothetical protein
MSDEMLAKVRKLLAKAENPACTEQEAEAYNKKAAELIAAYGIDRALLAAKDPTTDKIGDRIVDLESPYALSKADLLSAIARSMRCRAVLRSRWADGKRIKSMHLFGYDSDLERAELLFTSLLLQSAHGVANAHVPPHESTKTFRLAWLAGFTVEVEQRLRAAEVDAQREATQDRKTTMPGVAWSLWIARLPWMRRWKLFTQI